MQESKNVTVNGKAYQVFHIPPTAALRNYLKLQKLLLGPLGEALNSAGSIKDIGTALDKDIDLGKALGKLAESIDPDQLTALFKELIEIGAKDGGGLPIAFEIHFMGNIADVFGLVKEVISFNYPNFFGMLFDLTGFVLPASTPAKLPSNP